MDDFLNLTTYWAAFGEPVNEKSIDVKVIFEVVILLGFTLQSINVVNVIELDQADTLEVSTVQAERTWASYVTPLSKPVIVLLVPYIFCINFVQVVVPNSLALTS